LPRSLRHSLRNLRDSAGSWPSIPGVSGRETAGSGPGERRGRVRLCCQVGRFGFAADSPTEVKKAVLQKRLNPVTPR
jgi:hypothetical protein